MTDEEIKNLSNAEKRRAGLLQASQPTVRNVGGDPYLEYINNQNGNDSQTNNTVTLPTPKATPMGVVNENGVNDNLYANNLSSNSGTAAMNNLFDSSWLMTPEEEERRRRRAEAAAAVGNLGNLMSGFANLYYVNKGAPSQTLPEATIPDYMKFTDRVNQARKDALAQQMARENLLLNQRKEDRMNAKHELDVRKQEWREQYERGRLDIQSEKNRIDEMYKNKLIEKWERDYYIKELDAATRARNAATNAQNAETKAATEARLAGGYTQEETNNGLSKTVTRTYNTGGSSNQGSSSQQPSSVNASQQQKPKTNTSSEKKALGVKWVK